MAPSVKLAIVFKTGEEASLLVFLHLLYTLVEKQPYLVIFCKEHFILHVCLILMVLTSHVTQNGG